MLRLRAVLLARVPEVAAEAVRLGGGSGRSRKGAGQGADEAAARAALLPPGVSVTGSKRKRAEDDDGDEANDDDGEGSDAEAAGVSSDDLWAAVSAGWAAFGPYRDATVDRWGRKLAYASGLTAKQAVKLKVLNSDLSKQVDALLAGDRERLLARTRLPRAAVHVLGAAPPAAAASAPSSAEAGGAATENAATEAAAELDPHTYDDGDLYQSLLKEYVAAAGAASAAGAGGDAGGKGGRGLKRSVRAGVDRRASKARKIRFVVHPKLVNFMAPAPYVVPPEAALDMDVILASMFKSN
jgi:protein AATF/BFR2